MESKSLKIAISGIRGIPACYGGFETFAEELSQRLVEKGHQVVVYGRSHVIDYKDEYFNGVKIKLISAPRHKYFETPLHTLKCLIDILKNPVDVVLICNAANSPFIWLTRISGTPILINLDGIERKRAKWNWLGRLWYRFGEISSVLFSTKMIADAEVIREYYLKTYRRNSVVLRYGFSDRKEVVEKKLASLDGPNTCLEKTDAPFKDLAITPGNYLLYVSRLEPENNAHVVIEAYNKLPKALKTRPLVIVGGAPYAQEYIANLKKMAGENIIFAGSYFGEGYRKLQLAAYLYIQATEVGGTHPALVEAQGYANCVVANSTPENIEVLRDAGVYYEKNDADSLCEQLEALIQNPEIVYLCRKKARKQALSLYSWDEITSGYEELFRSVVA